MVFGKILL